MLNSPIIYIAKIKQKTKYDFGVFCIIFLFQIFKYIFIVIILTFVIFQV